MSQKVSRKAGVPDEKEKRQADSPVKDMKKKMAANAEKEKQAAEKTVDKPEKAAEKVDKPSDKTDKDKPSEKKVEKSDKKPETAPEKKDKKPEPVAEKKDDAKEDKAAKPEKQDQKAHKSKQNGNARVNGASNGDEHNGMVSAPDDDDELMDEDEMFPELAYDSSDPEFEPDAPPRSFTRRSQAKVTRTPETPRPASDKQDPAADDSKESKVLKLKDDVPSTDRKLRSADSPKPQEPKKPEPAKKTDTQDKLEPAKTESPNKQQKDKENDNKEEKENAEAKTHLDVVVEVEGNEDEPRKTDTNFSKSRVKVSPYRRSLRIADQTTSSVMANYTGNNTTMEMDITESSSFVSEDPSLDDSSYLSGLRSIRGRRSYKPLKEMALRHVAANSTRISANISASEQPSRPTGTVVGRKRKPEPEPSAELSAEPSAEPSAGPAALHGHGKRLRLLDRLFRRHDGAAEIVGINTDLPLTAPVASTETFDPETLKNIPAVAATESEPVAVPLAHTEPERDNKRCVVM